MITTALILLASVVEAPAGPLAPDPALPWQDSRGTISWRGQVFANWDAYRAARPGVDFRCGTMAMMAGGGADHTPPGGGGDAHEGGVATGQADCSASLTNPSAEYAPSAGTYVIPVVFHILRDATGRLGDVPVERIAQQVAVLNRDFAGSIPGNPQLNTRIAFKLATTDPNGTASPGYTISNNTQWYNDQGNYWQSLAWDPSRYLNIYTNTAQGLLGYATFPQIDELGWFGSSADRVIINWEHFGEDPDGAPYDLGRTCVHEVGHYLGLFHTFHAGCGTAACASTGDRICDTNPEAEQHHGCDPRASCSALPDPINNFMDYSSDSCLFYFTADQARRMRCTLLHWRTQVWSLSDPDSDITDDGLVNGMDLGALLSDWGNPNSDGDIDGDGTTGASDVAELLSDWGP